MSKHLIKFDWAIKNILRSKANFGILEGFLSELLKQDVTMLEVIESESNKEYKENKFNRVDILVKLTNEEIVLIEIQINMELDYFHRMLFGTSKVITEHLEEGERYSNIKKVYSVNILYFDLGYGSDYIYHGTTTFKGMHKKDTLDLSEKQKLLYKKNYVHEVYPEYFLIKVNQFNDIAKDTLDEWIYFLKNEEIKDGFHAKGILEAKEKLSKLKLSEPERQEYSRYVEDIRYQESIINSTYISGKADGLIEGKIEGKMEGKMEVAKKLKKAGISDEVIKETTGISVEQIDI